MQTAALSEKPFAVSRGSSPQGQDLVLDRAPLGGDETLNLTGAFEFAVPTTIETYGLSTVSLHVAGGKLGPLDQIEVWVLAQETNQILAAWIVPGSSVPATPGWLVLHCPTPLTARRQTAVVLVRGALAAGHWLALSRAATQGADASPSATVALRLYSARPLGALSGPSWNWERVATADASFLGLEATAVTIPARAWLGARLLGSARQLDCEPGEKRLRIGCGAAAMLVFPQISIANFATVVARIDVQSGTPEDVAIAMVLLPADRSIPEDLAEAAAAALRWSPLQKLQGAAGSITFVLPQDAPGVAHVGVALRQTGSWQDDFALVSCGGVWLLPKNRSCDPSSGDFFAPQALAPGRDTSFNDVRLDEIYSVEGYRHLDLSVFGLLDGGRNWDHVKFKLFADAQQSGLEFRSGPGWSILFRSWPGTTSDEFSDKYTIKGAPELAEAIGRLPEKDDREMLAALRAVLPNLVQTLAAKGDVPSESASEWLDIARNLNVKDAVGAEGGI